MDEGEDRTGGRGLMVSPERVAIDLVPSAGYRTSYPLRLVGSPISLCPDAATTWNLDRSDARRLPPILHTAEEKKVHPGFTSILPDLGVYVITTASGAAKYNMSKEPKPMPTEPGATAFYKAAIKLPVWAHEDDEKVAHSCIRIIKETGDDFASGRVAAE
ncbi:MAG: hypothetical protein M1823_004557 [Watsoniomyces obsoletus]|nr:MAG: hypothetical protein M1823_004557 [Watsoniomyces obsoletus]